MEHEELNDLHRALVQSWQIEPSTGLTSHAFLDALTDRVAMLLKHNLNRLTSAMYTLDVDETRFNTALSLPGNRETARTVAELILEREIEKMISRRKYRETAENNDDRVIEVEPNDVTPE
jgi:hypothetical protein